MFNEEEGKRIRELRTGSTMTQGQLAEKIGVTTQAVSNWERGETAPDSEKLTDIAIALNTTVPYLLNGTDDTAKVFHEKIFDEEHMYTFIKGYAASRQMEQTLRALSFARDCHRGQKRSGKERIPYIVHPLNMACHALALGITEDNIVAAALLHDVCEDCGVKPDELPVGEQVKEDVITLTHRAWNKDQNRQEEMEEYYAGISNNKEAAIVKLLDRCQNVSFMAYAFSKEKLRRYISETRTYVLPLLQIMKEDPKYSNQYFLLKYHICSVIGSIEATLNAQND